jgi:ribose 5-phosphate isomerase A
MSSDPDLVAQKALEFIEDGQVVGLGTGRAAVRFIRALGERVQSGLRVRGIPTSESSAQLARELGIPLTGFTEVGEIDVAVDGADEVDPQGNLIKGWGGALVREKLVAMAAKQFVVLVGTEKLVDWLGTRGKLPVEVIPFAYEQLSRLIHNLGYEPIRRSQWDAPYITDNGNFIVDCHVTPIAEPAELERRLTSFPGVVGTGLFLGMADTILIDHGNRVEIRSPRV